MNESFISSAVPAMTTSFLVSVWFVASHSSRRRMRCCTLGSFSMSSVSSHVLSSVGCADAPPDPAAIWSSLGMWSRVATYSSRYPA